MSDGRGSGEHREVKRLCAIPRGQSEELRVSLCEYSEPPRPSRPYVAERVWYRDATGEMRPGRAGVTIRRSELAEVITALKEAEALIGSAGPASSGASSAPRERRERTAPQRTGDLTTGDRSEDLEAF